MCARSSEPPRGRAAPRRPDQRGFTVVELIAVLLLAGVLAAVAVPRLGALTALRGAGWHDQVRAGLLHARALAQGHRRLVCLSLATGELRLAIASANPASSCNTALPGPDGDARWAHDDSGVTLTLTPAGTLYFQPDGRITSDGAGASAVNASIALAGQPTLTLNGETGHVP